MRPVACRSFFSSFIRMATSVDALECRRAADGGGHHQQCVFTPAVPTADHRQEEVWKSVGLVPRVSTTCSVPTYKHSDNFFLPFVSSLLSCLNNKWPITFGHDRTNSTDIRFYSVSFLSKLRWDRTQSWLAVGGLHNIYIANYQRVLGLPLLSLIFIFISSDVIHLLPFYLHNIMWWMSCIASARSAHKI